MIQFTLKCDHDHRFDSWFQSAEAYEKLHAAGMVVCSVCGSGTVEKALMAPSVRAGRDKAAPEAPGAPGPLSAPATPAEQALAQLKKKILENSEYVGVNFAREARKIHQGETPERAIHGEAGPDEARKLLEEGVPVMPLPFLPDRKTN